LRPWLSIAQQCELLNKTGITETETFAKDKIIENFDNVQDVCGQFSDKVNTDFLEDMIKISKIHKSFEVHHKSLDTKKTAFKK